mmetsp:Transcript_50777/g.147904  ORF Transcript_50777/g.147904 Transcript_50777/m.147904 type:complete len:201 (+) Transcript_50777:840-1442(+)
MGDKVRVPFASVIKQSLTHSPSSFLDMPLGSHGLPRLSFQRSHLKILSSSSLRFSSRKRLPLAQIGWSSSQSTPVGKLYGGSGNDTPAVYCAKWSKKFVKPGMTSAKPSMVRFSGRAEVASATRKSGTASIGARAGSTSNLLGTGNITASIGVPRSLPIKSATGEPPGVASSRPCHPWPSTPRRARWSPPPKCRRATRPE